MRRLRPPGWPGSMASLMFALLLVGIVATAVFAFAVAQMERRAGESRARQQRVADRVVDLVAVLSQAPRGLRASLLGQGPDAARLGEPGPLQGQIDPDLTARLAGRLGASAGVVASEADAAACGPTPPPPPPAPPSPGLPPGAEQIPPSHPPAPPPPPHPPDPDCRRIALTLPSGERIALTLPAGPKPPRDPANPLTPAFLATAAAAAAALAYAVARLATAPLRRLSRAAGELGHDLDHAPLTLEGPLEVRRAALAFNAMQGRLKQTLAERTHMLAAIAHDLQTPMTRLRLRLDKVADPELRAQLLGDHAAMLELVREGLDLARASSSAEPLRELDLDSLLHSLAEDAIAAGAQVAVAGECGLSVRTRPQALRRAVANLLDNALKYAGAAELSAEQARGVILLRVRDHGPGIPADRLQAVLEPFVRLEPSRSRDTGGVGLGLTIARLLAERAGAALSLSNRAEGGLDALIAFQSEAGSGRGPGE